MQCYHEMQVNNVQDFARKGKSGCVQEGSYHIYKSQRLVSETYLGGLVWFICYMGPRKNPLQTLTADSSTIMFSCAWQKWCLFLLKHVVLKHGLIFEHIHMESNSSSWNLFTPFWPEKKNEMTDMKICIVKVMPEGAIKKKIRLRWLKRS